MEELINEYIGKIFNKTPSLITREYMKELVEELTKCKRRPKDVVMEWCYWHNLNISQPILEFSDKVLKSSFTEV